MKHVLNSLLVMFLLIILVVPVALLDLPFWKQRTMGMVAGVRTTLVTQEDVAIIPNLRDFDGSVSFNPQGLKDGRYRDTVTLTVYPRYVANYRQLYRIYNNSSVPLRLRLETGTPRGDTYAYQDLQVSLSREVIFPNEKASVDVRVVGNPEVGEYLRNVKVTLPLVLRVVAINQ